MRAMGIAPLLLLLLAAGSTSGGEDPLLALLEQADARVATRPLAIWPALVSDIRDLRC